MPPKFRRPPPRDPNAGKNEDDDSFFSRNKKGWNGVDIEAISTSVQAIFYILCQANYPIHIEHVCKLILASLDEQLAPRTRNVNPVHQSLSRVPRSGRARLVNKLMTGQSPGLSCMSLVLAAHRLLELTHSRTLDDSNDSDEIEIVGSKTSSGTSKGKGKQRTEAKRNRSITPPPQLSKEAIRNALNIAKYVPSLNELLSCG